MFLQAENDWRAAWNSVRRTATEPLIGPLSPFVPGGDVEQVMMEFVRLWKRFQF